MDAICAIKSRRSARVYKNTPVPANVIEDIVDCGRLAASAVNAQPWEFVAVTDPDMRKEIASATDYGAFIASAPVCIAVFCKDSKYYLEDGCAATETILVAATALGIQSCWVAGDKKSYAPAVAKLAGVPEGYKLVSMIALGYETKPAPMPKKRDLKSVLHWEQY